MQYLIYPKENPFEFDQEAAETFLRKEVCMLVSKDQWNDYAHQLGIDTEQTGSIKLLFKDIPVIF